MSTWLNADGLYIKFGPDEGKSVQSGGAYCTYGPNGVIEWDLDLTELTETEAVQNDVLIVPQGALIAKVEVETLIPSATGVAIDVGLVHISRDTADTEFTADPDGILAAFVAATMANQGEIVTFFPGAAAGTEGSIPASTTTGGALIGTIPAAPTLLTASRTTSTAFTAGRVLVRVYVRPNALAANGA